MRDAFIAKLLELAQQDSRIMLLSGDLGFAVFDKFRQMLPKQFINMGVAEQNMIGVATGLARSGKIVFTYSISNFGTLRCLEHIRSDVAYHQANVKVVAVGAGFSYGALGMSHHCTEDLAIFRSMPNMSVVVPGDRWEVTEATEVMVKTDGPFFLRLDKTFAEPTNKHGEQFALEQPRLIVPGTDLTIVACGGILQEAIKAALELKNRKISARVINVHALKPLDSRLIQEAARETEGIITLEEHVVEGGLGSAIAEELLENGVAPRFFYRMGLRGGFSSVVGSQEYLRGVYDLNSAAVIARALELIARNKREFKKVV